MTINDWCLNLKRMLCVFIPVFLLVVPVFTQVKPSIERQALFKRAFQSLGFFMHLAQTDESFIKNLTADERLMLNQIYEIVITNTTFNWLLAQKTHRFQSNGAEFFAYAITKNRIYRWAIPSQQPIQLQFVSDPKRFDLDPEQPPRDAVTGDTLETDIYVNLDRINRSEGVYDLAAAVSLMVHEFGHKLGSKKIQSAIDGLAARMENFIRSQTNVAEFNGKKISILRFRNMPSYDQFIEDSLYGRYLGVNIPPQVYRLSVFDQQGVYVWVESSGKINDISERITEPIRKKQIVSFESQPDYQFLTHNIVLADSVSVQSVGENDFRVTVIANLQQFVVPFLTAKSIDPRALQLYERAFKTPYTHHGGFYGAALTLDGGDLRLKKLRPLPQIVSRPQIEVQFLRQQPSGQNHELYFSMKGLQPISLGQGIPDGEWWPELKIQIDDTVIVVRAESVVQHAVDQSVKDFKFIIKSIDSIKNRAVTVIGVQLRIKNPSLVLPNTASIAKLFLQNEIPIFPGQNLAHKISPSNTPKLKSIQIVDGPQYIPLKKKSDQKKGQLIRLVFESTETLRELSIDQSYQVRTVVTTTFMGQITPSQGVEIEDHERTLRFEDHEMRQSFINGQLVVEINLDQGLSRQLKVGAPVQIDHSGSASVGALSFSGFSENYDLSVEQIRSITGLSFVTQSGQTNEFNFKNPLRVIKPSVDSSPESFQTSEILLKCMVLFK